MSGAATAVEDKSLTVPAEPQMESPPVYKMPEVFLNDSVTWYDAGDTGSQGHPAVVVGLHADSVDVRIVGTGATQTYRTGVRHVSDPKLKQNVFVRESGGWDYSESTLRLAQALARIAELESRFAALEESFRVVGLSEPPKVGKGKGNG